MTHRRSPKVALLTVLLALLGACRTEGGAPASPSPGPAAPNAAPPTEQAPPGESAAPDWVRPAPAEGPEQAFLALFEALGTNDPREIGARLVGVDECEAMTADPSRCTRVAIRRKAFLAAVAQSPLPPSARLSNISLLRSIELPEDLEFNRTVRMQLGHIRFSVDGGSATLGPLAAMEVEGGWRILPGKPQPRTLRTTGSPPPPAGAPTRSPAPIHPKLRRPVAPTPAPAPAP